MTYQVRIEPANATFEAQEKESLLHASLRAGLNVDHGCTNGVCGQCKARLIEGQLSRIRSHDYMLSEAEKLSGTFLMCCHSARSTLKLETSLATGGTDIPQQDIRTHIRKIESIDDNTLRLTLRTPRVKTLRFMSGQHALLSLNDHIQRELPIASCPCDGLNLEFHLHRSSGDPFTEYIFQHARRSMQVRVTGPCNGTTLMENDRAPILFIAWGIGFASVQSLLESCISLEFRQQMTFHWVVHDYETHYADGYCRATADAFENFDYHPIQTSTAAEAIEKITNYHTDLSTWRSYIFAPPAILDSVIEQLMIKGMTRSKIQSDPIVA